MLAQVDKIQKEESFPSDRKLKGKSNVTPEQNVLEEFNKKYAIVHTNTTSILFEKHDGNIILDTRQSLIHFHENDNFIDSGGNVQNKGRFWLKHPKRRTFLNLVFNPMISSHYEGNYNIFKGYAITPKKVDCSLYWDHIKNVICNEDIQHYTYVRKWMACVIQKPSFLATALVLRGSQGTGKNKFVENFGKIFGKHFLTISSMEYLVGRFNSHLQNAFLIFANEALWTGNKKEIGFLKTIITDPKIIIEGKGKDAFEIDNCRHLIIASNEDYPISMDIDDRRFFVLNVSDKYKGDFSYFSKLDTQMSSGGINGLMYDLINEDLSDFDPRIMPHNDHGLIKQHFFCKFN